PVRVRFPDSIERTAESLAAMPIASPSGRLVPFNSVAHVYVDPGGPELNRENQRLMVGVTARLEGVDLGTAVRKVQASLKDVPLPPGYSLEYGCLYKSQQESFSALGAVLAMAAAASFTIMVFALRSFRI